MATATKGIELAVGYVSIVPETSKVGPGIEQSLAESATRIAKFGSIMGNELGKGIADGMSSQKADIFSDVVRQGTRAGDRAGEDFSNRVVRHARSAGRQSGQAFFDEFKTTSERTGAIIGKIISAPMAGTINAMQGVGRMAARSFHGAFIGGLSLLGIGGGLGIGAFLTKGLERLQGLDNAQRQLERMSKQFQSTGKAALDYKAIQKMLTNDDKTGVLDSTPFALNEAMGAVQLALQGGVDQGKQLTEYMTALADAAGATQQPFSELSMIFTDIVNKGRLETDEIEQLQNRMINIPELLKQAYGWSNEELQKNLKEGKVTINEVAAAIEKNMGGAAKSAGDTLQGSIDNMGAAVARVGAKLIAALTGTNDDPLGGMKEAVQYITTKLNDLGTWITNHKDDLRGYFEAAKDAVGTVLTALGNIAGFLKDHPTLIKASLLAFAGFQTISGIAAIATAFNAINTALLAMPAAASGAIAALGPVSAAAAAALALYFVLKDDKNLGNKGFVGQGGGLLPPLGGWQPDILGQNMSTGSAMAPIPGNAAGAILGSMAGVNGGIGVNSGGGGFMPGTAGRGFFNSAAASAYLDQATANAGMLQSGNWQGIDALASSKFGLAMTSGYRDPNGPPSGAAKVPANQSYHASGRAHDFSGSPQQMAAFAAFMASNYGSQIKELIYGGLGWNPAQNILNGQPHSFGYTTLYDHGLDNPQGAHVHVAFASGGGVNGPGTNTSDSIPAWLSNGEHVLSAADVAAMGGQDAVYKFRSALHRAGGGPISEGQVPWPPGRPDKKGEEAGNTPDLRPGTGYPNFQGLPHWDVPGMRFGPPPSGWWENPINPDDILFPEWMPPGDRQRWFDEWKRKRIKALGYAGGGEAQPWDDEVLHYDAEGNDFFGMPTNWLPTSNDIRKAQQETATGIYRKSMAPWLWTDFDSRLPDGPGNFNPNIVLDTSHFSISEQPWFGGGSSRPGYFAVGGAVDDSDPLNKMNPDAMASSGTPVTSPSPPPIPGALDVSGVDPNTTIHGMAQGALPGPEQAMLQDQGMIGADQQPNYGLDFVRSMGFIPASAGSTGVAGTSSLAKFINMGNSVVSGVIDTGTNLAQTAVSAAIAAGAAGGTFGAAAPAAPLADMAASYGIQLLGNQAKRVSSYWFQLGGILADAAVEQMFPFGAPRWLGYDYTQFAPQLGIQQALTSTVEKMGSDAIKKQINPAGTAAGGSAAGANPFGPVTPSTMPGAAQQLPPPPDQGTPPPGQPMPNAGPSPSTPQPDPLRSLLGYDEGGMLPPGGLGINMTGRPEPVLTPQQWDSIMASSSSPAQAAPLVQNLYAQDMQDAIRQLDKVKRRDMMQYAGRS